MAFSKSLVIVTVSAALTLLQSASANIQFSRINMTAAAKPGDVITVSWTEISAANNTVLNLLPFNLSLRALSGQRYNIQNLIPQEQLTIKVTLPKEATGGQHSFYCDYTGTDGLKSTSSNQFNITGAFITTTTAAPAPATSTLTPPIATHIPPSNSSDGGLSGAALGGIIGGVVAVLLMVALVFFVRNRRLARERGESSRLEDTKERYEDRSIDGRSGPLPPTSAPSGGPNGYPKDGMVSVPLNGVPGSRPPRPSEQQHEPMMMHHSNSSNPFEGPGEAMMMGGVAGAAAVGNGARAGSPAISGPTSLSPRQQHHAYSPPQLDQQAPGGPPGGPMMGGMPPHQQQQGGYPGGPFHPPPHQQQYQHQHHPGGNRDSFESEPESAYDPSRFTMQQMNGGQQGGPVMRNNSNPMMRGPGGPPDNNNNGSPLSHSLSGRSNMSGNDPRYQNASPHPHNPFQDPQLMAAAAGGAGMMAQHHQQQQQQQQQQYQQQQQGGMMQRQMSQNRNMNGMPRSQSPMGRSASPYNREIEMQPLEIQQHQYEQQQRVLQRQQQEQQKQQQQQQQQQQAPLVPAQTQAAPSKPPVDPSEPYSPANFDDKTEIDEDGVPVYNGYRDTIFGAYAPQGDDDDEDEEDVPMPIVPAAALAKVGEHMHQQQKSVDEESSNTGGGVQRKKSVKFTGVPASGPIVVPTVAAASSTPAPVPQQQQQQQQQHQNQHQQNQMYYSDDHDDEDHEFYEDEDEHDIKMRMLESEVPSPTVSSNNPRPPFINTTPGSSPLNQHSQQQSGHPLSPVQGYGSPTQHHPISPKAPVQNQNSQYQGGFVAPPPPPVQQQQQQQRQQQSNLMASSSLGGFYEDVLAAVDKNAKPTSPTLNKPSFLQGPPPPSSSSAPPPPPPQQQQSSQQHYVQQQHIPTPQPVPIHQEVFGAPSPRIVPAGLPAGPGSLSPPSQNAKPTLSPRSAARPAATKQQQQQQQQQQHYRDADEDAFYESSLL